MSELSRAVFLSYASQDVEAAQRICEALRAAGIEVWFDKSELRGGDAWDQSIRRQIKQCALLIPVISRHTHERTEGYFRLEWKLAVDRSHLIAANKAFLLPVVIDDIGDDENVPDKFREVQWTQLPAGQTSQAFVARVLHLLSGRVDPAQQSSRLTRGTATNGPTNPLGVFRRSGTLYGVMTALLLSIAVAYFSLSKLHGATSSGPSSTSIAVLPLANESGDANEQYFSDGLSEDLITALGQFPALKVIGRTSSFQFRDSKEDSRSIGAKLGVAHLLEGSVRKSGTLIRVSAALIDTRDGSMQWSQRYDRAYKDLFALQDEITRAVTQALKARLLPDDRAAEQSERPPSGNLEAYNAFLQGQFYGFRDTETDARKAIEYYAKATELDPGYALAWSKLAVCWTDLASGYLEGVPAQEAYAKAREAIHRALEIAPDLAFAHAVQGNLLQQADFDWHGAEQEFRRALALAPNDGEAKYYLGTQLAVVGDVEEAVDLTRQALVSDPLRANWFAALALHLAGLNRLDEAEQAIRRAIELQPHAAAAYFTLTVIEVQRGHGREALDAAQLESPGDWQDSAVALALQIGKDRSAADAALKTLIDKSADGAPFQIAEVYALRNEAKSTFEWLDRAWNARDAGVQGLLYDPFILRYKDDPRFTTFCRKVGLPAPAESSSRKSPT